jgi:hypothetical protein
MKKNLVSFSLFLAFSLILGACAAAAPTQDPGQVATQVAAQVEAQVATRVAQAMGALEATKNAQPTSTPFIPTVGPLIPTLAPIGGIPTIAPLPGVATAVACNPPPRSEGESHPDGTSLYINTAFTKTWTISNQGSCTWNANYKLKFVSGDQMGGPSFILFGKSVPPWQTITLALPLKTSGAVGTTTGYWGFYDDKDVYFGRAWVTINTIGYAPTSASFAVTNVKITQVATTCTFSAAITANGAGRVTYTWRASPDGSTYTDQLTWTQDFAGATTHSPVSPTLPTGTKFVKIYIKPNNIEWTAASVIAPCF